MSFFYGLAFLIQLHSFINYAFSHFDPSIYGFQSTVPKWNVFAIQLFKSLSMQTASIIFKPRAPYVSARGAFMNWDVLHNNAGCTIWTERKSENTMHFNGAFAHNRGCIPCESFDYLFCDCGISSDSANQYILHGTDYRLKFRLQIGGT